eukprot:404289_1
MAATKSVNSWDLTLQVLQLDEEGNKVLFIDRRDWAEGAERHQCDTPVGETAREQITEEKAAAQAEEAKFINQAFQLQCHNDRKAPARFGERPFSEETTTGMMPCGYRYRKFERSEKIHLVARCDTDGAIDGKPRELYRSFALNETDMR